MANLKGECSISDPALAGLDIHFFHFVIYAIKCIDRFIHLSALELTIKSNFRNGLLLCTIVIGRLTLIAIGCFCMFVVYTLTAAPNAGHLNMLGSPFKQLKF